jgi:membrane protein insertase Oxa1/YidC/SpoIIIJ
MADIPLVNSSEIIKGIWSSMPFELSKGIGFIVTLGKAISIAFLVYIIFLIIQSVVRIREALRMKSMAQNIAEINQKLSLLVDKKNSKELKKSKDK